MARLMARFLLLVAAAALATEPAPRTVESVVPALDYGPSCWSSLNLHNLGDRVVTLEVEAHRAGGALVALLDHPRLTVSLNPGQSVSYRLDIQEETGDAWVKVRELVPSPRFAPVVAVAGTSECTVNNQLRTTAREVAYPTRNPWFAGDISEISGNVISLVNTSERTAKALLCYSAGNLYSTGASELTPICSESLDVQVPPFGARQFPVTRGDNSHFSLKTQGSAIVLEMLRPLATGVKIYTVDSTIRFQQ